MSVDRDAVVSCPLVAIKTIAGEPLRIFLALKHYILAGGNKTVPVKELSKALGIEESFVRIYLAELKVEKLIVNDADDVRFFFSDDEFNSKPFLLNEFAKQIDTSEAEFQNFLMSITEADPFALLTSKYGLNRENEFKRAYQLLALKAKKLINITIENEE